MMLALSITREGSQERAERVLDEHQRIYEALALRDVEGATLAMRSHLIRARQRVTDHERDA
jgi:GntR family transcriptional repressor for pyruvate dehydrogenase complex